MKIEPEIARYLNGEVFQTTLSVDIVKSKYKVLSREAAIIEEIKGSKVIHIGCSDHIQVIAEKIKNNIWLHKLITENAEKCVGIDIDKESIAFVRDQLGYNNVFAGDIIKDDLSKVLEGSWDYAVFGELIEHLGNPVNFLQVFREKYGKNVRKFIITVPSIYNKRQFRNMLNYKEIINSDHRFWFTPYTISKVLSSAGYKPGNINFVNLQSLTSLELSIRKIKKMLGIDVRYPFYYFNTLIVSGAINRI